MPVFGRSRRTRRPRRVARPLRQTICRRSKARDSSPRAVYVPMGPCSHVCTPPVAKKSRQDEARDDEVKFSPRVGGNGGVPVPGLSFPYPCAQPLRRTAGRSLVVVMAHIDITNVRWAHKCETFTRSTCARSSEQRSREDGVWYIRSHPLRSQR